MTKDTIRNVNFALKDIKKRLTLKFYIYCKIIIKNTQNY